MAVLYYIDFSGLDAEELLSTYADKADDERLSKLTRTLAPEAKVRSLLAGYLLRVGLLEYLQKGGPRKCLGEGGHESLDAAEQDIYPVRYRYGENGKPYFADYPEVYFNLSHSKNVVVCAFSGQEIGVDIQKHVKIKGNLARRFFSEEEFAFLETRKEEDGSIGKDYENCFFRLWSIKESFIKFTGKGMKQGLDSFRIIPEEERIVEKSECTKTQTVYYKEIFLENLPEYTCSVCMETQEEIRIVKIKPLELTHRGKEKHEELSTMETGL